MGIAPKSTGSASDKSLVTTTSSGEVASAVPAWMAARRARSQPTSAAGSTDQASKASISAAASPSGDSSVEAVSVKQPINLPTIILPESDSTSSIPLSQRHPTLWQRLNDASLKGAPFWVVVGTWLTQIGHHYGSAMIGFTVSMAAHAVAIISLAVIVISGSLENKGLNIFGVIANSDDSELADINLDSSLQVDPGQDAAALAFPDLSQVVAPDSAGFEVGDSLRGVLNGVGSGDGEGGEGSAMPAPTVNVPSYAVIKGSFSAWTEPRDPIPGKQYVIVIQVRVPPNIKKYRASDLTGRVTGTDRYRQVIKFRTTDEFAIKDGAVQIRVPVPGAAQLVRDTIQIESRVLREKQTIHIEF